VHRRDAGRYVPPIHFLHLRVTPDADPAAWRVLRVGNQIVLGSLHTILAVAAPRRGPNWQFEIRRRTYVSGAPRRTRLARLVVPGDAFQYAHAETWHTLLVEGWSGIRPGDPPYRYLAAGGSFDLGAANAALAALDERPPRAALH
jgi:hypothetical protein